MESKYNPKFIEKGKNQKWIDQEFFSKHNTKKEPFAIILPPPNITGKLHLGHAWNSCIQDCLIRYHKLIGKDVLWIPGMDHAGIATQAKVEEKLYKNYKQTKYNLGREKFVEKIWQWKEEYACTIRKQWGKLGLALDYKKERFTMDQTLVQEVNNAFIKMYEDKLIYRGKKAVNWDYKLQTVLSNIEVENKEISQPMFYFKYFLKDSPNKFLEVATTRPETMFADVAIAINPQNKKLSNFIGKIAISPLNNLELPIIADENIQIDKGSGIMKVSAHATIDIDIILKNNLKIKECIDQYGKMNHNALDMANLDILEARKKVVALLKTKKTLIKQEEQFSSIGYSSRSGAIIEILVMPQWFIKMKSLAKKIILDLKSNNGITFFPSRFGNDLQKWMEEVHDWCISRQLWWGHRIPAWYKNDKIKIQNKSPGPNWKQEEDVLDTWFSSSLAPFSFLGGIKSKNYQRYYPTNVLVTGYDIIFFWVSRMYFQGLQFTNKKPFENVLIHGLIRAEDGKKMSKSLGNGIDPMDVIQKYGADALRWFLLTNSTPGQDIRYSKQKLEASWNLNNKLWNISRFIIEILEDKDVEVSDADKWISNKLYNLEKLVDKKIKNYDFTIIGKELTNFIVEDFSSWYIEFLKTSPHKKFAINILKRLLQLLHPFMIFITDHIFNLIDGKELLNFTRENVKKNPSVEYIDKVISIVKAIRKFREEKNISNKIRIYFKPTISLSQIALNMIKKLTFATIKDNRDALIFVGNFQIYIQLDKKMKQSENQRIFQQIEFVEKEIQRAKNILANKNFMLKASHNKIKLEQDKLDKFTKELKVLKK